MVTTRTEEFLQAVARTPLFAHVGEPLPQVPAAEGAVLIPSWSQALKPPRRAAWSELKLEVRGDLTSFLAHQHPDRDEAWNRLVQEIRPRVLQLATPACEAVAQREKLAKSPLASVSWDLVEACMEYEYADLRPPGFYDRLGSLYLLGRFPCGWQGDYPDGSLEIL
jgi:hypothetical protein